MTAPNSADDLSISAVSDMVPEMGVVNLVRLGPDRATACYGHRTHTVDPEPNYRDSINMPGSGRPDIDQRGRALPLPSLVPTNSAPDSRRSKSDR